jgi:hypothetical protein
MKLLKALERAACENGTIRRKSWSNEDYLSVSEEGVFIIKSSKGIFPYLFILPDITATDWEITPIPHGGLPKIH